MISELIKVEEFHKTFKIGNAPIEPTLLSAKESDLRFRLMKEENDEYDEATQKKDLVEIADALGDQLYILCGTILKHGLHYKIYDVFEEIHQSNMSKLDDDGNPIFRDDGKIMKSSNYFKPNIKDILDE